MGGLGLALLWFGYWTAFYGYDQLNGGNNSFLSLGIPGRFKNAAKDSQAASQAASNSAASVTLQTIQNAQQQRLGQEAPGGPLSAGPGSGVVAGAGGVTVLYDARGNPTCMDKAGNTVPCPAGTPSFAGS